MKFTKPLSLWIIVSTDNGGYWTIQPHILPWHCMHNYLQVSLFNAEETIQWGENCDNASLYKNHQLALLKDEY